MRECVAVACQLPLDDLEAAQPLVIDFKQLDGRLRAEETGERSRKLFKRRQVHEAIVRVYLGLWKLPVRRNGYGCALVDCCVWEDLVDVVWKRIGRRHRCKRLFVSGGELRDG